MWALLLPPLPHYVHAAAQPPGRDVTLWCLQKEGVNLCSGCFSLYIFLPEADRLPVTASREAFQRCGAKS